jgi:hypothetical protein
MDKPYRSIDFNDERKWKSTNLLDDVLQVGVHKAIGYVSASSVSSYKENVIGTDLLELEKVLIKNGKITLLQVEDSNNSFLWAGDQEMIQSILNKNQNILLEYKYPTDAKEFFMKLASEDVIDHNSNQKMYHLVAELFNSWCLWCEDKIWIYGEKILSTHPYDPDNL